MRRDALTGAAVVIAAGRQERPHRPGSDCPFCPGGLEAPEPYEVRWFPNRWPPLPDQRCEVVLYSPDHRASLASLDGRGARRIVDVWAERTEALGARPDVAYVLCFENRGAEVGATIDHPHGQIYAFADVPDAPRSELGAVRCALCSPPPDDLVVTAAGGWRAWVPPAATWPYELRIAPDVHRADLPALDDGERDGLALTLTEAAGRLDRLFDRPMPYMLWVHQRPTDGAPWPGAHVHLHIAPLLRGPALPRYVAAGELGSGTFFNPVEPADAARALRDA